MNLMTIVELTNCQITKLSFQIKNYSLEWNITQ